MVKKLIGWMASTFFTFTCVASLPGTLAAAAGSLPERPASTVKSGRLPSGAVESGGVPSGAAKSDIIQIAPIQSKPHGKSYSQWAAEWWQWALEANASENPLIDTTGKFCHVDQPERNVFFLAGGSGSSSTVERSCTIRTGKALFFPIANNFFGTQPRDPAEQKKRSYCRAQVEPIINGKNRLTLKIDSASASRSVLLRHFERSIIFTVLLPKDNIFGEKDRRQLRIFPTCDAGYYVFLSPLPPGKHTLHWTADTVSGVTQDVTYHLTVLPGASR